MQMPPPGLSLCLGGSAAWPIGCATNVTGIIGPTFGSWVITYFRRRVAALFAIGKRYGRGEIGLGQVLEGLQMLARSVGVTRALKSAGQPKLRRRM